LLDISNNNEYKWTTIFDPSPPSPPIPSPLTPPLPPPLPPLIGAILGSLLGGILLSVGSFLIYKWNKNKQKQKTIYENENYTDYSQEEKELPIVRDNHNNEATNNNVQEIIQIPNKTNHEPTEQ
jgi:hypothetical protein